ncbi:sensor histidine kinase [Aureimonas jatrophae]|uniref:histidine kinase n=1 Tax=Aureimonas jatrophae TaxID=1166073 RepID=A0A1H0C6C1_9HYPH|nr:HWE histidine kinase domain-containing protein [Aureimonas jatrophae]MBB3949086.1 two-component sensor histidine kinase [Aureimonas jatrophae]SDN53396.1 Two-component sensor histidine kinase, contains HisKA and HATPase domains [Aureimonas jatrophae]
MKAFVWAERISSTPLAAWTLAALAFLTALGVRFASDHVLPAGFPYLTFFPAVILTAFFAGLWPGVACAVLSGLAAWYWFIPPVGVFTMNPSVAVALLFYIGVVSVDLLLIHVTHRAVRSLRVERAQTRSLLSRQKSLLDDQQARVRQQAVLQRELSHRMKNTLAMVQAVVSQSLRNALDTRDASEKASARIQALASAQDVLTATDWAASDVAAVVAASVAPHCADGERVTLQGPPARVEAQQALGLALAIHELSTNAVKYGALSTDEGRVSVRWDVGPQDRFAFVWEERGGPPVAAPERRGFGSKLTERIVPSYFGGSAASDYEPGGLIYTLNGSLTPSGRRDETA